MVDKSELEQFLSTFGDYTRNTLISRTYVFQVKTAPEDVEALGEWTDVLVYGDDKEKFEKAVDDLRIRMIRAGKTINGRSCVIELVQQYHYSVEAVYDGLNKEIV